MSGSPANLQALLKGMNIMNAFVTVVFVAPYIITAAAWLSSAIRGEWGGL